MASAAGQKNSFRKVNVDDFAEERFKDEEDDIKNSGDQLNDSEIQSLLQTLVCEIFE